MGRKSRYKKYKAVDPFCTGERKDKLMRHENVFNKAPKKEDFEQKPPKGFLELMNSMKQDASRKEKQEKKRKRKNEDGAEDTGGNKKKKNKFERHYWESDGQYIARVDRIALNIVNREKMEILKSGGDKEIVPKKLTKEKERKLKRIKKAAAEAKRKKQEEQEEYSKVVKNEQMLESLEKEMMKDKVEFGEVAMEPPTLTKAPRKSQDTSKPGQRELLLKGLMSAGQAGTKPTQQRKKANQGESDSSSGKKKGKRRKDMSALEKARFDQTRSSVIEAYRKQRNTTRISLPMPGEDLR